MARTFLKLIELKTKVVPNTTAREGSHCLEKVRKLMTFSRFKKPEMISPRANKEAQRQVESWE